MPELDKSILVILLIVSLSAQQSAFGKSDPDWQEEHRVPSQGEDADQFSNQNSGSGPVEGKVEKKDGRTVLKLGVEHAKRLSPISVELQAGSIFDDRLLDEGQVKLIWYPIPKWLAGQWRRTQETTVFSHDYASGYSDHQERPFMSEQIADFGVQTDAEGNVWNCNLGSRGVSDRGSYRSIAMVLGKAPVETSADSIIFREVFVIANVNKTTNVILDSYLSESITRHRRNPDGSLETSMSVKVYNASGIPRQVQENIANDRLIKPFKELDTYKGRDIKADFAEFLRKNGRSNLIPN